MSRRDDDYRPRTKSKTERFLSALDQGGFRDAVDAVRTSAGGGNSRSSHADKGRHRNYHHYDSPSDDDDDRHYRHSTSGSGAARRSNTHHGHTSSRSTPRGANRDYYYPPESHGRSSGRARTGHADDYYGRSGTHRSHGGSGSGRHRDDYHHYGYSSDDSDRGRPRRSRSSRGTPQHHSSYKDQHQQPRRQTRSVGPDWAQAGKAALMAGVVEGWKSRNRPGGGKVKRIATAAVGAAAMDAFVAKDRGDGHDDKSKRHITQSTIGGLMLDRILNGSAKR